MITLNSLTINPIEVTIDAIKEIRKFESRLLNLIETKIRGTIEMGDTEIRHIQWCNALSPGGIYVDQDDAFIQRLTSLIPLGRMAHKDEYKAAVAFLVPMPRTI